MEFRAISDEDIDYMKEHSSTPEFYKQIPEETEFSYALVHDDKTLVVGGFRLMNKTTCVNWFDISDVGYKNIVQVVRTIKEWSEGYTDKDGKHHVGFYEMMGILRAEAYVRSGHLEGERFVKHFDFTHERVVLKYFGEDPANLFVKFFDHGE